MSGVGVLLFSNAMATEYLANGMPVNIEPTAKGYCGAYQICDEDKLDAINGKVQKALEKITHDNPEYRTQLGIIGNNPDYASKIEYELSSRERKAILISLFKEKYGKDW